MRFTYRTQNTCATQISFNLEGNVVRGVEFTGGCNGNLKAIQSLVEGMTVEELESRLSGISCGRKGTSCPDQLTKAVRQALGNSD